MKRRRWLLGIALAALISCAVLQHQAAMRQQDTLRSITEVSVEHTRCYGGCPVYKVILHSDDTATFIGRKYTDRIGTYTAGTGDFERVSQAVREGGFFGLRDNYTMPMSDHADVITSVVQRGQRKTIDNYGDAGPQQLWELQAMIDGTVSQARWTKVSDSTAYPAEHSHTALH